jgi:hypothetical protein
VNAVQLAYTISAGGNAGLIWFINTAYIISLPWAGNDCRTFIDTSGTSTESLTIAGDTNYIQQVN